MHLRRVESTGTRTNGRRTRGDPGDAARAWHQAEGLMVTRRQLEELRRLLGDPEECQECAEAFVIGMPGLFSVGYRPRKEGDPVEQESRHHGERAAKRTRSSRSAPKSWPSMRACVPCVARIGRPTRSISAALVLSRCSPIRGPTETGRLPDAREGGVMAYGRRRSRKSSP